MAAFNPHARATPHPAWHINSRDKAGLQTWCRGGHGHRNITPVQAGGLGMQDRH